MLNRLRKTVGLLEATLFALSLWNGTASAQASNVPRVRDQREYDLSITSSKEKDPKKQLGLLRQWEQEYPDSDFKAERELSMAEADRQIILIGLRAEAMPAELDAAKNAAVDLLNNLNRYLAPQNRPVRFTVEEWEYTRLRMEQQARAALLL